MADTLGTTVTSDKVPILPEQFDAVLFDLDGVVTKTAKVHATAWKKVFDAFLKNYFGRQFKPFDIELDYHLYVDGKPRYEGVKSFLATRNIELPWGTMEDAPGFSTICALGNAKNQKFLELVQKRGVEPYESSVALIRSLRLHGIATAVITASQNGRAILQTASLLPIFDVIVDGLDVIHLGLKGKPAPDIFLEAARQLNVKPDKAAVVEDAVAGVQAASQGGFALVIGVARDLHGDLLAKNGADIVVKDLSEIQGPEDSTISTSSMVLADLQITEEHWCLKYTDFVSAQEKQRESLCALGNGYFTTRGAAPESKADIVHYPGTYLAGGYNRLKTKLGEKILEHEDLVNLPNWLPLTFRIGDGQWFSLRDVQILSYQQILDIRTGILYRDIRFQDEQQHETTLKEKRFVHMRYCHLAGLETTITAHNWSGKITIRTALDGSIVNAGSQGYQNLNNLHMKPVDSNIEGDILYLKMKTLQSGIEVAEAARTRLALNGTPCYVGREGIIADDYVAQDISINMRVGEQIVIEKIVSLFTSRDKAISEPGLACLEALQDAASFTQLATEQAQVWRHLWHRFDLDLDTLEDSPRLRPSLVLHLHIFHLLQAASPHSTDLDTGIPPRGWTGETYRGHIFWDELFAFPFLTLHIPGITAAALKYRYRRLGYARRLAASVKASGALFPWQSGSDGREETPKYVWSASQEVWKGDYTYLQMHVNSAIAYNIWQYYQITGNLEFMFNYGAEMLFEIARFWGSFSLYNPDRDRYEIHGVVGPDEYHMGYPEAAHPGINNNAYTNLMAVWVLCRALDLLEYLPSDYREELCERLDLKEPEIILWRTISLKMFIPFHEDLIISQFEGYEKLQEFPKKQNGGIDTEALAKLLKQSNELNQYQVSKQADVLMLFYLFSSEELKELFGRLGYAFNRETILKNVDYYIRKTANNSTLSRVAHAWVLSRLDRTHAWTFFSQLHPVNILEDQTSSIPRLGSWDIFLEALGSDLFDIQGGTTAEGIHLGAMAGTVDIIQRCYTGIVTRGEVLWLNPYLPDDLIRLSFNLHYRHQSLRFEITHQKLTVTARHSSARPIKIGFRDHVFKLHAGECRVLHLPERKVLPKPDEPIQGVLAFQTHLDKSS